MKVSEGITNKEVLLGVTGGIAAYKSPEIVRQLIKIGCNVTVAMTDNARKFIKPLTFETLTGNEVITDMFETSGDPVPHISKSENVWSRTD